MRRKLIAQSVIWKSGDDFVGDRGRRFNATRRRTMMVMTEREERSKEIEMVEGRMAKSENSREVFFTKITLLICIFNLILTQPRKKRVGCGINCFYPYPDKSAGEIYLMCCQICISICWF